VETNDYGYLWHPPGGQVTCRRGAPYLPKDRKVVIGGASVVPSGTPTLVRRDGLNDFPSDGGRRTLMAAPPNRL